jgi:hypothetical protein
LVDNRWCALFAVFFVLGFAAGSPELRLGPCITYGIPWTEMQFSDSAGNRIFGAVEEQPYVATGVEAEYGPVVLFRFRMEVAQVRFYTHGGLDFVSFPLGGEVSVEPPFGWRFRPYLFVGGEYASNFLGNSTLVDSTTMIAPPVGSLRAGVGGRFALSRRVDVYGTVQLFTLESSRQYVPPEFVVQTVMSCIGVDHVRVGVSIALGRLPDDVRPR